MWYCDPIFLAEYILHIAVLHSTVSDSTLSSHIRSSVPGAAGPALGAAGAALGARRRGGREARGGARARRVHRVGLGCLYWVAVEEFFHEAAI